MGRFDPQFGPILYHDLANETQQNYTVLIVRLIQYETH